MNSFSVNHIQYMYMGVGVRAEKEDLKSNLYDFFEAMNKMHWGNGKVML